MTSRWQFSSQGWRNPSNPWFRLGTLEVTTTILIVAIGVVTMFMYAASTATFEPFWFTTPQIRSGELWRLASWPLINAPTISGAITLALFYMFGREIEAQLGRNRFLGYLAAIIVLPAAITTLVSLLGDSQFETGAAGLRLVEFGVFAAYVAERPNARFFFGIPGWVLFAVIFGIDILQLVSGRFWLDLILEVLVVLTSIVIMRGWGFADEVTFIPRLAIPGGPNRSRAPKPARRSPKTKSSASSAKGSGTVVAGPWSAPTPTSNEQRTLDELLDKVASKGLAGLSDAERRQLDELSRKMRDNK